jgi:hypothetical protein
LLFFGSFDAKSPNFFFLASWANTRQKISSVFFGGKNTGLLPVCLSECYSPYRVDRNSALYQARGAQQD